MALLFSAVTVTAGEDEIELLVGGIPREYDDLEGWSEFDDLMYFISEETEVSVCAEALSLIHILYAAHHSFILCFVSYRNMAPIVNSDGTVMQQQFLIIPTTIKIPRLSFNVIKTI